VPFKVGTMIEVNKWLKEHFSFLPALLISDVHSNAETEVATCSVVLTCNSGDVQSSADTQIIDGLQSTNIIGNFYPSRFFSFEKCPYNCIVPKGASWCASCWGPCQDCRVLQLWLKRKLFKLFFWNQADTLFCVLMTDAFHNSVCCGRV